MSDAGLTERELVYIYRDERTGDLAWDWDEWEDVIARAAVLRSLGGPR